MVFWIAVAVLAAAVTFIVTRPLLREPGEAAAAGGTDIAVYKDQLAEIDADAGRGLISGSEAEAARAEVARRLLRKAQDVRAEVAAAGTRQSAPKMVYLIASLTLPLASLGLYLIYGAPGLPGAPLKERLAAPLGSSGTQDLIAKVEARLRDHPEDGRGWDVIAPVYLSQGQFADAAQAYATAIKLLGETPKRLLGFAEARIRAADGAIPDDARKALQTALAADPKNVEARFWLALAKEEDGDAEGAASDYKALIAEAPPGAAWKSIVEARLAALVQGKSDAAASGVTGGGGPSAEAAEAAQDMTPEARQAMIDQMVGRLAERLKTDPKDKAGWQKLIRAYQVLGRKDDAADAVARAKAGLAGDEAAVGEIDALAKALGVGE